MEKGRLRQKPWTLGKVLNGQHVLLLLGENHSAVLEIWPDLGVPGLTVPGINCIDARNQTVQRKHDILGRCVDGLHHGY